VTKDLATVFLVLSGTLCLASGFLVVALGFAYWIHPARDGAAALTLRVGAEQGAAEATPDEERLRQAGAIIERHVRQWGVLDPRVSVMDAEAGLLRLELPGADTERLERFLGSRAELELQLVERELLPGEERHEDGEPAPPGMEFACERASSDAARTPPCYLLHASPVIEGRDIARATPEPDQFGSPAVRVVFSPEAGERFRRFTAAHVGDRLAIVLDGEVVSAPSIQGEIGREALISGEFSAEEAEDLALRLKLGEMPALAVVRAEPISPEPWLVKPRLGLLAAALVFAVSLAGAVWSTVRFFFIRPAKA
jgi:protein-export membrane protein SecD